MSKGKPIEFDRDNITSVINEYKRVKKLNRHTQIEQSTIITDKYLKNKTAFPATKMYPNGIPIPYVLRALNKEQNDKYKSYGNQVKSYIEDLNMLRRFLVNDYIVLKNKLKAISETGSIKFSESMIKTEKSKIREKMDLIESWAFNNNEKLPKLPEKDIETESYELRNAHKIIKKLSCEKKVLVRRVSLTEGKLTDQEITELADKARFTNGNLCYKKLGDLLGVTRQTAKKIIVRRNLVYLNDPPQAE